MLKRKRMKISGKCWTIDDANLGQTDYDAVQLVGF